MTQLMKALIFVMVISLLNAQAENGVWIGEEVKFPACFYPNDYYWMYIRAFLSSGVVDKNARNTIVATKEYIPNRRLVINPTMKLEPDVIINKVCGEVIKGLDEKFHVYISVYNDKTWSTDAAKNRQFIEGMRNQMINLPNCYKTINIITRKFDWEAVFGEDYYEFAQRVLVWDKTSGKECSRDDFVPFGGWQKPDGVMFNHNVQVCENTVDVSCLFMQMDQRTE